MIESVRFQVLVVTNEWFSTIRRPVLCAQDSEIAMGANIASRYKEMLGVM